MPISINNAFANLPANRGGGRVKVSAYRAYERDVQMYALKNGALMNQARDLISHIGPEAVIHADYLFRFHASSIIMKHDSKTIDQKTMRRKLKGEPKRNDTSNRIKVLEDCLSTILGIDDCFFWSATYDKAPIANDGLPEHVDIMLSLRSPKDPINEP